MGLDNGIIVTYTEFTKSIPWLRKFIISPNIDDYEICYWRKCWNVRNVILRILSQKGHGNDISNELSIKDITKIIHALKSFNYHNWDDNGSSIWTWEEQKPHIKKQIKNLKKLVRLKRKHNEEIRVYFYDSY